MRSGQHGGLDHHGPPDGHAHQVTAAAVEVQPHNHGGVSGTNGASHGHVGTAKNTPPVTPLLKLATAKPERTKAAAGADTVARFDDEPPS